MSVTLKDVAEKLGVTITTVHKALNGKEGVSEKRRAEIMKVAAQMGYKVNYMASSLSKKKFHIAVVLPNTCLLYTSCPLFQPQTLSRTVPVNGHPGQTAAVRSYGYKALTASPDPHLLFHKLKAYYMLLLNNYSL